jgi:hypothetical protein
MSAKELIDFEIFHFGKKEGFLGRKTKTANFIISENLI